MQSGVGQFVDDGIESFFEERQQFALATAILVCSDHVEIRVFVQKCYHIPHNFRPLLEIGIDQADVFATRMLNSGK